jgi:putative ABC transport system ATP-binding protein
MLHQGRVLLDLHGSAKQRLTVQELIEQFHRAQGEELALDSLLLG